VGIGFGGPVDRSRGVVATSFHVSGWGDFPLVAWVRDQLAGDDAGLPVVLENDANAATLAEAIAGAGAGSRIVFYTNAGSGIGAGVVVNGMLYHGRQGGELELGHLRLTPGGGILETLASGWALDRRVGEEVAKHRSANGTSASVGRA
jgi:glucokinase